MNELNNTATAEGQYNSIPTSLTSNTSVVTMIEGLTLTKTADKQNWSSGTLTYTIVLNNQTNTAYENPSIVDIIDTDLVEFVENSVTINEVTATSSEYTYNNDNHTLKVTLKEVSANSSSTIKFQVKKKS